MVCRQQAAAQPVRAVRLAGTGARGGTRVGRQKQQCVREYKQWVGESMAEEGSALSAWQQGGEQGHEKRRSAASSRGLRCLQVLPRKGHHERQYSRGRLRLLIRHGHVAGRGAQAAALHAADGDAGAVLRLAVNHVAAVHQRRMVPVHLVSPPLQVQPPRDGRAAVLKAGGQLLRLAGQHLRHGGQASQERRRQAVWCQPGAEGQR